jgi:hypothetical protein
MQVAMHKGIGKTFVAFSNPYFVSLASTQAICEGGLRGKVAPVVSYERINYLSQILPYGLQEVYDCTLVSRMKTRMDSS